MEYGLCGKTRTLDERPFLVTRPVQTESSWRIVFKGSSFE